MYCINSKHIRSHEYSNRVLNSREGSSLYRRAIRIGYWREEEGGREGEGGRVGGRERKREKGGGERDRVCV